MVGRVRREQRREHRSARAITEGAGVFRARSRRRSIVIVATVLVLLAVGAVPAYAWWSKSATVTNSVTAATLQPPTNVQCTNQVLQNPKISWTAPTSGPNIGNYRLIISGGALVNGATLTQDVTGATSATFNSGLLSAAGTYTITVETVLYQWTSAPSTTSKNVTIALSVGSLGLASCS